MSMDSASWKISWKKYGISVDAFALLNAIASASVLFAIGTPVRVAKYFCRSVWKSSTRTRNWPSAGERVKSALSGATAAAAAAWLGASTVPKGGGLRVRARHDPRAAGKTDRRLDPDDRAHVRWAHDASVGLGADRDRGEVRRSGSARARARATGVAVRRVGVVGEAATT